MSLRVVKVGGFIVIDIIRVRKEKLSAPVSEN